MSAGFDAGAILGARALVRTPSARSIGVVLVAQLPIQESRDNAQVICRGLAETDVERIVFVEVCPLDSGAKQLRLPERVEHQVVVEAGPLARSAHVNRVVSDLRVDRIWIHDPDLWLPFGDVVPLVRKCGRAVLKPFAHFTKLSARESKQVSTGITAEREDSRRKRLGISIGKGSFVMERAVFMAAGGLSEAFRGAGDEGFELMRRVRVYFKDLPELEVVGAQLFRPASSEDSTAKQANKALHSRLAQRIDADLGAYLRDRLQTSLKPDPVALETLALRDHLQATLSASQATSPKVLPESLPGKLWALTCYFNPEGYRSKRDNFRRFREGLAQQGVPLFAVELAFDDRAFELGPQDAEGLLQVRCGSEGLLWQKERLLNLGLKALPADCDKVAWLDADILFSRPDWAEATAEALQRYVCVQCFTLSVRLRPDEVDTPAQDLELGASEHQVLHSMALGHALHGPDCLDRYLLHGHSGYAWAGRRRVLERHGFYDCNILGNADLNIGHALLGGPAAIRAERLSTAAQGHVRAWADAIYTDVQGSVGYIDGLVRHLWHGTKQDRRYHERLEVLVDEDFDPATDLELNAQGLYRWATDKPGLHTWCKAYFGARREDGP